MAGSTKIRLISQLHELACHPRYLTVLVRECTEPRKGTVVENVIQKVHKKLHDDMGAAVSRRACKDLIGLALELQLLEKDMHWAARGHVINYVSPPSGTLRKTISETADELKRSRRAFREATLPLEPNECVIYLKYFLDADGAFLIELMKELDSKSAFKPTEFLRNRGIERIFVELADRYLAYVFDIRPRYKLRQLKKNAERGYSEHVRLHKFTPRIETLADLGIIEKVIDTNRTIRYQPKRDVKNRSLVKLFLEQFNDPIALDKVLSPDGDFFQRVAKVFGYSFERRIDLSKDFENLTDIILKSYVAVRDETFRLAYLDAVRDIVCVTLLLSHQKLCKWKDVDRAIEALHNMSEKDIRYHVNDWGVISHITITDSFIKRKRLEA